MNDESLRLANCDAVRRYIDHINAWDFAAMHAMMGADMVFEMRFPAPGMPPRLTGRDAVLDYMKNASKLILSENLQDVWLDTLHSDPAEVFAEYRSDMTMADPSISYSNEYVSRFTVRDGLIHRFQENYDSVRAIRAFGGTVEPPATAPDGPNSRRGAS